MQKIIKSFLVLTFAAFGAFSVFSTGAQANFESANLSLENASAAAADAPADLYIRNCARCHGADGRGETTAGQQLDVPDLSISGRRMSAAKISRIIADGKDEMPGFGKKLNKKQIASIAAYVRKF